MYYDDGSTNFVINDSNFLDKLSEKEQPTQHENKYINQIAE
jgi:hypothetical protein